MVLYVRLLIYYVSVFICSSTAQWAHAVEYTLECHHDGISLKTTSIIRRNSVVEMTSIFLVDATSKKRRKLPTWQYMQNWVDTHSSWTN